MSKAERSLHHFYRHDPYARHVIEIEYTDHPRRTE